MSPDARLFVSSVQQVVSVTVKKYNTPPGKWSGPRCANSRLYINTIQLYRQVLIYKCMMENCLFSHATKQIIVVHINIVICLIVLLIGILCQVFNETFSSTNGHYILFVNLHNVITLIDQVYYILFICNRNTRRNANSDHEKSYLAIQVSVTRLKSDSRTRVSTVVGNSEITKKTFHRG